MSTPKVTELTREAATNLGHVIGLHVKIAQLEVKAEIQHMSRRARILGVLAALMAIGYALAMTGLAVLIGDRAGVGIPFVIIGLAHMTGAGAGLVFVQVRARGSQHMVNTTAAVKESLVALEEAAVAPTPRIAPAPEKVHAI